MDALLSHILESASRSPSAHNTQPWLLRWCGDALEISIRPDRMLPAIDPLGVETVHAIGAMLEAVLLTLRHLGYDGQYEVANQIETDRALVVLRWSSGEQPTPDPTLYRMIPIRRTSRLPYDSERIATEDLDAMRAGVEPPCKLYTLTDPEVIEEIRALVVSATMEQFQDTDIVGELYNWTRFSRKDPRWYRDGLDAACMGWKPWEATAARVLLAPPVLRLLVHCKLHRLIFGGVDQHAPAAPVLCLLAVEGDAVPDRIEAGRCLERIWLAAAARGLVTHPLSAALDVDRTRPRVLQRFDVAENHSYVNLFRVGRSASPARSSRLPADEILDCR